ncbi:putative maleylacetate reductase [Helianthus anomalus]
MIHFCKWKQHMDPFFGTRSHIKTTHRSPRDIPETPIATRTKSLPGPGSRRHHFVHCFGMFF